MARKRRRFTAEFKGRVAQARQEARGEDPRPAREDRRAHGRAGFLSARVRTLSRAERMRMILPGGRLDLWRQCVLLGVSRSSLYYRPKGEGAENLALLRRMDELHMEYPFYGSRQMMRHLRREGVAVGRHRIRATPEILEHGSGRPVHQRGLRRPGVGRGHPLLDGRPGPLPRQHLHRTAVAVAEVRGRVPARTPQRAGRGTDHRDVGRLLQRRAPALVVGRADAGRGLPRWSDNIVRTTRRGAVHGPQPARPRLRGWRSPDRRACPSLNRDHRGLWRPRESTLTSPSDCPKK